MFSENVFTLKIGHPNIMWRKLIDLVTFQELPIANNQWGCRTFSLDNFRDINYLLLLHFPPFVWNKAIYSTIWKESLIRVNLHSLNQNLTDTTKYLHSVLTPHLARPTCLVPCLAYSTRKNSKLCILKINAAKYKHCYIFEKLIFSSFEILRNIQDVL